MPRSLISQVNLDSAKPFRRYRWLYVLIVVIALSLGALLAVMLWMGMRGENLPSGPPAQPAGPVETPSEKTDRIVIMNILNSFQIEAREAEGKSKAQAQEAEKESVQRAIRQLESLDAEPSLASAQTDVLSVLKQWEERLDAGTSLAELKPAFVKIAREYPWLNTLAWIIILNRL